MCAAPSITEPRPRALRSHGCACRVYHEDWETFAREAEKLYTEHPSHVRLPACAHSSCCVDQAIGCTDALRDEIPAQRREDGSEGHK